MRIVSFELKKYRSIEKTEKIPLSNLTVLVGPNNEGKSNILRGLVTALKFLSVGGSWRSLGGRGLRYVSGMDVEPYEWRRDFPIHLRTSEPDGKSEFDLTFDLSPQERASFQQSVGVNIRGNLRVRLSLGIGQMAFEVKIRGPVKSRLGKERFKIARFLGDNLDVRYIPAVRTSDSSQEIVEGMLDAELSQLGQDERYTKAVRDLLAVEQPVLDKVAASVKKTLSAFIPDVRNVSIRISHEVMLRHPRGLHIVVDDGHPTELNQKGDGVQNLAAIALIRHVSQSGAVGKGLILAIEEPESHLHPDSIHHLRAVLKEISQNHQVIITTHSPILVDREEIPNTVIVESSEARPARSLRDVRDALGVRISDNLTSANLVLLVEGVEDESLIRSWLAANSDSLKKALSEGILVTDNLGGGSKLSYKAWEYKSLLCGVHAFVDDDQTANQAIEAALKCRALELREVHKSKCLGRAEAELEDLIDPQVYVQELAERKGVNLDTQGFRAGTAKWSKRLADELNNQAKPSGEDVVREIKSLVHDLALANVSKSLSVHARMSFDALIAALEARVTGKVQLEVPATPVAPVASSQE